MTDILLRVDPQNTLAAAIVYLAALAYPEGGKSAERAQLAMRAWCGRPWREAGQDRNHPELAAVISTTVSTIAVRDMENALKKLNRMIGRRLETGKAAVTLQFFNHGYARAPIPLDKQARSRQWLIFKHGLSSERAQELTARTHLLSKPFTLNTVARQSGMSPGKFKDGVWKETLPALHLALALHSQILEMDLRRYDVLTLLISHARWTISAIRSAESWAENLPVTQGLQPALKRLRDINRVRIILA